MEKYLENIFKEMVLETKSETIIGHHSSCGELEYKTYYDVHRLIWTSYEKAVEGYLLNKFAPTINKFIKEK